ncbi:MAG: hypothetical protein PHI50_00760 [Alphaproteobacteria bacterium]|nr:hypothetical protein [Alphaproteobacteria bacterium]
MNMEERLQAVVSQAETDGTKWHAIIHGDNATTVSTENGEVPTVAKQMADVRNELINGVADYLGSCQSARDTTLQAKTDTLTIKSQTETLKTEAQTLRDEAENFKNLSQSTFNNISGATNTAISTIQTEGTTQITLVQSAVAEQVAEATAQANRAEQATDSKVNLDLSNMHPTATSILSITRWLVPDWTRRQIFALNTNITITKPGWVLMRNTDYTTILSGYINDNLVFTQCGSYGHWQEWNSLSFLVDIGDVVKLSGGELSFFPCKGVS